MKTNVLGVSLQGMSPSIDKKTSGTMITTVMMMIVTINDNNNT